MIGRRRTVAIRIGLQTQVLKSCSLHHQIFFDEDADPASAFALAITLIRQREPVVAPLFHDEHALTDLLSDTFSLTPVACLGCQTTAPHVAAAAENAAAI